MKKKQKMKNPIDEIEVQPVGRPSIYLPEYCNDVIEHMAKGFSLQSFAGLCGVNRQTLYLWKDAHPEFREACEIGMERSRFWWEKVCIENLVYSQMGKRIDPRMWQFNMMNRFREDWTDNAQTTNQNQFSTINIVSIESPIPLASNENEIVMTPEKRRNERT